jgi:hypothetical protein
VPVTPLLCSLPLRHSPPIWSQREQILMRSVSNYSM